jgi:hypothetical protein
LFNKKKRKREKVCAQCHSFENVLKIFVRRHVASRQSDKKQVSPAARSMLYGDKNAIEHWYLQ